MIETIEEKVAMERAEEIVEKTIAENAHRIELRIPALAQLPENLLAADKVSILHVEGTNLRELPDWLPQMSELGTLQLFNSGISTLPAWLPNLAKLEHLNISGPIENVEVIGELSQLRILLLQNWHLQLVPDSLRKLRRLERLLLARLGLHVLPPWLGELAHLSSLNAESNHLYNLPRSISRLAHLEELILFGNLFTAVPPILSRLPSLKYLNLTGNPGLRLPEEVLAKHKAKQVLNYARKLRGAGQRQSLNEAKMILVGRGAVGKTTLVHQLVHGRFAQKTKTKGIKVSQWKLLGLEGEITTHVWDFGGQEILHGTHQFFLTERSLYVLVLAGREDREDEDAEYWLKMIRAFGGDSPVIVVLNKIKEHHFDLNEEALKEKFPNIVGFLETDCKPVRRKDKEGHHISRLRKLIVEQIVKMDSVRAAFPTAWREIKQRLTDMKENFLPFDHFRAICDEHGEKSAKGQEELAHYLHLLGIALNYRDDPRLRETSVLNPKWVTTGIYRLLNDPVIRKRRGVLRRSDLSRVLSAEDYPKEMHDFLLLLMKKFELCFPLDDEGQEHLIPELLGKKQPKLGNEFEVLTCLCFEYHYGSLLPEGLLPRFIVRAYTRIEEDLRWRTGVVLGWKGARALVKADEAERQVLIRIHGSGEKGVFQIGETLTRSEHTRRELLALIREHFDHIHRNFKKLEPIEKIHLPGTPGLLIEYGKLESKERGTIEEYWRGKWRIIEIAPLLQQFELPGAKSDAAERGTAANLKSDKGNLSDAEGFDS